VTIPLDVVQHEHRAERVGERSHRLLQVEPQRDVALAGLALETRGVKVALHRHSPPPPLVAPGRLQHHIDRQPVEPGAERRLAAERPQPPPGADEHLLHEVGRPHRIGRHPEAEGVDPPGVAVVQRGKRVGVAALGPDHVGIDRRLAPGRGGQGHSIGGIHTFRFRSALKR